jgi:hypothetical protein
MISSKAEKEKKKEVEVWRDKAPVNSVDKYKFCLYPYRTKQ